MTGRREARAGQVASLSGRLAWRLAAVMLVAIVLAAGAIGWRAVKAIHDLDDLALQGQAGLIAAKLPSGPDAAPTLPPELVERFRSSDADNVFLIYRRTQGKDRLVATSDSGLASRLLPLLPAPLPEGFFRIDRFEGHAHGMVGLAMPAGAWRVVVLQGREQTAVLLHSMMGGFVVAALWLLLPLGAGMVLVGVLTLRHGLRPLRKVSSAAALVGPSRPGARLPVDDLPAEIAPVVYAMNDALARLELALATQRRFMSEAAHALRTPLAVLTARLDMVEDQSALAGLRGDADRMGRLVGQLMRMARLEGLPVDVTQPVDLHGVAVEAITGLVPLGLRRDIEIALEEPQDLAPCPGNQAALVMAVTNLIENALAYAPPGSVVEVKITAPGTIAVMDRGPGVEPAERERIFRRFERGAAPREGGAGLGLAIVAEIAAAHGGTVEVMARGGGGAAFVLTLGRESPVSLRPDAPRETSAHACYGTNA